MLASLDEVQALLIQPSCWGVQLEGPEEVGALGECRTHVVDLVDEILDADDVVLAQLLQSVYRCQKVNLAATPILSPTPLCCFIC